MLVVSTEYKMQLPLHLMILTFLVPGVLPQLFSLPHKMAVLFYYEEDILRFLLLANRISSQTQVQSYIANCQERLKELPILDGKDKVGIIFWRELFRGYKLVGGQGESSGGDT